MSAVVMAEFISIMSGNAPAAGVVAAKPVMA